MTSVTTIEIRTGRDVCTATVCSTVKRYSCAPVRNKGLSAGSRAKMNRFYDRIDRDLAKWEREQFPRKKRRHGKRRHRRYGEPIQLLKDGIGKGGR